MKPAQCQYMLLYGIEGLIPTKMERKELDDINTNIMRRIINTPPPPPPPPNNIQRTHHDGNRPSTSRY